MYSVAQNQFNQSVDSYLDLIPADDSYDEVSSIISSLDNSRPNSLSEKEKENFSTLESSANLGFLKFWRSTVSEKRNAEIGKEPLACSTDLSFEVFADKVNNPELFNVSLDEIKDISTKKASLSKPLTSWNLTRLFNAWNQPVEKNVFRQQTECELKELFKAPDLEHMTEIHEMYKDRFSTIKKLFFTEIICRTYMMAGEKHMSLYSFLNAHLIIFSQLENYWREVRGDLWHVDPSFVFPKSIDYKKIDVQPVVSEESFTSYINHLKLERKTVLEELLLLRGPDELKHDDIWRNVLRFSELVFTKTVPPKTWHQMLLVRLFGRKTAERVEDCPKSSANLDCSITSYRSKDRLDYL